MDDRANVKTAVSGPPLDAGRDGDDLTAARRLLASACKDGVHETDTAIAIPVADQAAQGRAPAYLRHQAMATCNWAAPSKDAGKAQPVQRVTQHFVTLCNGEWREWSQSSGDAWKAMYGPKPKREDEAAGWMAARQAWKTGQYPQGFEFMGYAFPPPPEVPADV